MRITLPHAGESSVLDGVSWAEFLTILDDLEGRSRSRVAYDRGRLELVSPSKPHERIGRLLGRFVEVLTEELGIDAESIKATTLLRADLRRGAEADECFYIANEPLVRQFDDLDLARDPPPDLTIEVDITRRSVNRLTIYHALGIPEVWRYQNGKLEFLVLGDDEYVRATTSRAFRGLRPDELLRLVELLHEHSDTELARRFRAWVRRERANG